MLFIPTASETTPIFPRIPINHQGARKGVLIKEEMNTNGNFT
jgi:hypothetical protein